MEGNMDDIFKKVNSILEDKNMSDNLKNIINNFSSDQSTSENNYQDDSQSTNSSDKKSSNPFADIDINTILKIKNIMDSFNNGENDPRSNLLLSLKPYMGKNKKERIDQYIKFLQFAKVMEMINITGGEKKENE